MAELRRLVALPLLTVVALALFAALARPHPAHGIGVIVVVDSASDAQDPSHCTLRAAIMATNTNADVDQCLASAGTGPDAIVFSIGTGTPLISIGSTPLPTITAPVAINGHGDADRVEIRGPGGVPVSGHHGLTVSSTAPGTLIRNLVIDNSADDGIEIRAANVTLLGNFIGTNAAGTAAAGNLGFGVQVFSSGVHIGGGTSGGPCLADCNLISGNHKDQILLDIGESGATVKGNFIGLNVAGTARIPGNGDNGIVIKGNNNVIGGTSGTTPGGNCTGDCNLIVASSGVLIAAGSAGTQIMGNIIGTDVSGTSGLGGYGIDDIGGDVTVGGKSPSARNLISGTFVAIQTNGGMTISGNFIGTNAAGTAAVANNEGVIAAGPNVVIGGADGVIPGGACTGACNIISGNLDHGVFLGNGANGAIVFGNVIGLQADGVSPLGNSSSGVLVQGGATGTEIGGPSAGDGNVVAFNGIAGVMVAGAGTTGDLIRGNSIYLNTGKGIDLMSGGNTELAPPMLTGVNPVTGTACAKCTIELFSDSDGQGKVFEGTSMADNAGNWSFNGPVTGPNVTATATDLANDTSQFSAPASVVVATPTPSPSPTPTHTPSPTPTPTSHPSPTVRPCGSPQYKGDADGNGHVDIHDVLATLSTLAGVPPGATCPALAEVDCDDDLGADDAVRILDFVAGAPLAQPTNCPGVGTLT